MQNNFQDEMLEEYDFSNGRKNPYAERLKNSIPITLDKEVVDYFKDMETSTEIPYQTLIALYLTDCAANKRQIDLS